MTTAWLPDVVPDQTIASTWGNTVRDRTVTPFANAAARDAALVGAARKTGMEVWLTDVQRLEMWTGAVWVEPGARGRIGYAQLTNNTGNFNQAPGGNVGLTVTITNMPPNRLLLVETSAMLTLSGGPATSSITLKVNGGQIHQGNFTQSTYYSCMVKAYCASVAGTMTFETWGWIAGAFAIAISAGPTLPAYLAVTDLGGT